MLHGSVQDIGQTRGKTTRPLKVVFADHFPGVTFKSSTYHDQRTIWHNAPEHLKKQFCEAGHTRRGRWIGFTAAIQQYNIEKAQANNNIIELLEYPQADSVYV